MSEPNLYRTENYQNYINSFHSKPRLAKSYSDVKSQPKIDDGDSNSVNSVESLNNYLDVKVRDALCLLTEKCRSFLRLIRSINLPSRSSTTMDRWHAASMNTKVKRNRSQSPKLNRYLGENGCCLCVDDWRISKQCTFWGFPLFWGFLFFLRFFTLCMQDESLHRKKLS